MKKIILIVATLFAFTASANDSVQDARRAFDRMSTQEAMASNLFDTKVSNIFLPGTSSYIKGTSLCIANGMIQTSTPAFTQVCVAWTWRDSDGDRRTTTNAAHARRVDADCSQRANGRLLASPINYTSEVTIWGARSEGQMITAAGGSNRVFRSFSDADDAGTPVSLGSRTVSRSVATSYNVDFFKKSHGSNRFSNSYKVGSVSMDVNYCN